MHIYRLGFPAITKVIDLYSHPCMTNKAIPCSCSAGVHLEGSWLQGTPFHFCPLPFNAEMEAVSHFCNLHLQSQAQQRLLHQCLSLFCEMPAGVFSQVFGVSSATR